MGTPTKLVIIANDGDCFYSALINSLKRHPYGNLIVRLDLPSTVEKLRKKLIELPGFNDSYENIFDIMSDGDDMVEEIFGQVENLRLNNKGNMKTNENGQPVMRYGLPSPWMNDFMRGMGNLEDFLEEARQRVGKLGPYKNTVSEYANDLDIEVIKAYLEEFGIKVRIERAHDQPLNFGTKEQPFVYVYYNGADHYDSIIPKVIVGGTRKRRSRKPKTKRRY
jgi:hypothetical protein